MTTSKAISNLNASMLASVLLHGGLLLLFSFSINSIVPKILPKGVEHFEVSFVQKRKSFSPAVTKQDSDLYSKSEMVVNQDSKAENSMAQLEGVADGVKVDAEQRFLFELQSLLERKKSYPRMAKALGLKGTVKLEFTLQRDGKIQSIRILNSAHQILNQAAMELVESISSLKPIPLEINKVSWVIQVPVDYKLN